VQGLTTFTLGGEVFVAASAMTESALSLFHLGSGGVLTEATAIFDNSDLALGGARYNAFANVNGTPFLLGTGQAAGGISTFEIGGRADRLRGTSEADLLLGFGGNDSLKGGAGSDRLKGGAGHDKLEGGNGRDLLMGDQGNEDFIFTATKESGPAGRERDHIEHFRGKDEIVLRKIDADRTEKGNQAFEINDETFDAGDIRIRESRKGVLLEMNIDRDAKPEMSILLAGFRGEINNGDLDF
jgi:Ca2+-binding RTX toxin-like protein